MTRDPRDRAKERAEARARIEATGDRTTNRRRRLLTMLGARRDHVWIRADNGQPYCENCNRTREQLIAANDMKDCTG